MSKFNDLIGDAIHGDKERLEARYKEITDISIKKLKDAFDEMAYVNVAEFMPFVASDLYSNLLTQYADWLCRDYSRVGAEFGERSAKDLRQLMLQQNREAIIKDLNQDNLDEITKLKEQIEDLHSLHAGF